MPAIVPDLGIGLDINSAARAELSLCYTCGSCAAECPVNRETDRLPPLKYVRMAGLGMIDELLRCPDIWYCLSCNRCSNICPMTVKPGALLSFFRKEAERKGFAVKGTVAGVRDVARKLHRVRWHAAFRINRGERVEEISDFWDYAAATPVPAQSDRRLPLEYPSLDAARFRKSFGGYPGLVTNITSCFTCCECTNNCPVSGERQVFDPMRILRMVTFGLREELLASPSIWLCLDCRSCTFACSQLVRGDMLMRRARELAVKGGFVDRFFPDRWREVQKKIFTEYVERIDTILYNTGFAASGKTQQKEMDLGEPGYEIIHKKQVWRASDARHGPVL